MSAIGRLVGLFRRLRVRISRREAAARVLGFDEGVVDGTAPGLVLVQIDGLARGQLERAIERGRMPYLRRLLRREGYRLGTMYSGLPSTTPAVQGEIFYGVKAAVPAFVFRDRETGEVVDMLDAETGARREKGVVREGGKALLKGGSAYCDMYCAGAKEAHFCASTLTYRSVWRRIRPWVWPGLSVLYLPTALRVTGLAVSDLVVAIGDAVRGVMRGEPKKSEFEFVPKRVLVGTVLREWMAAGARLDVTRGLPVVHVNFLGYDERAHRRGPGSAFAHRSLRGIDHAIRRIAAAAHRSDKREYEVWVYSDHGQERTAQYARMNGKEISERASEVSRKLFGEATKLTAAAVGPVGHVYPEPPLGEVDRARLAKALADEAGVPAAFTADDQGRVRFWMSGGRKGALPDAAADLLGADHPHREAATEDLVALCGHRDAGQVVIAGWVKGRDPLSFVGENGGHAGFGPEETSAFTLLPSDAPVSAEGAVRPSELREAVFARLAGEKGRWSRVCAAPSVRGETIRLVTYNVHGCVGTDGRLSPRRIARVIASCDPDIVALQELDVGRRRSGGRDQADDIARELNMECRFHASFEAEGEAYGNAVLSRFPLRVVKAAPLPQREKRATEPRGALWVEAEVAGRTLQVVVTHLGLAGDERLRQVEALLGPEWLGGDGTKGPALLCGDLNAPPRSAVYRRVVGRLRDAAAEAARPRGTFPSRWPVLRLDHVFATGEVEVISAEVARTSLAARASDHLPLVVEIRLGGSGVDLR